MGGGGGGASGGREEGGGGGGGGREEEGEEEGRRWCTKRHNQAPSTKQWAKLFTLLDVVVVEEGFAKVCQTGELGVGGGCSQQLFG